ncbi:hypothetical protein N7497_003338 [Penicillium chrysogenum]|nr:hypothetical protein N7497_003338 [Penicillium chrysogenum]
MSSKFAKERRRKAEEKQRRRDRDEEYRAFMADFGRRAFELQRRSASPARASQASPRQRSPWPEPPRPRSPPRRHPPRKGPTRLQGRAARREGPACQHTIRPL